MKNTGNKSEATAFLRQKAEKLLKKRLSKSASQLSEAGRLKLIHELEVHQIELEMQNDELLLAKEQAETAAGKYTELYDFAPSGYFTLSKEGKIVELNLCGSQMLGKERSRLKNRQFGFFVSNDTKPIFNLFLNKVFNSKAKESCEVTLVTNGNLPIHVYLTGGIVSENGEQCLVIAMDITERKLVEKEVFNLNAQLEQRVIERTFQLEAINKELEAFTYSVSHDLRAPLRAVDGFSKFLLEDYKEKLDSEGNRLLGLIRSNTRKMDQLICDLMNLSQITRKNLRYSDIDMTQMAISMFYETATDDVKDKTRFKVDQLPEAFADPTFLKQVWINLLSNAIKFTSKKKIPEIKISGKIEKHSNTYYIKDNGVGFNQEYIHKLFTVFQRLHKSEDFEGTGVGLAIVQRIIHRHGGKVGAGGEEGKGATFWFSLPAKK